MACGIRTPSFMTKVGLSSQRELDVDQHSAPLTQVSCLDVQYVAFLTSCDCDLGLCVTAVGISGRFPNHGFDISVCVPGCRWCGRSLDFL